MAKKPQPQDDRTPLQKFYDNQVRELADQQPEAARDQIEAAFADAPANPDDVDPWFDKHFREAPVAHDTQLYNRMHALKAALRDALTQQ